MPSIFLTTDRMVAIRGIDSTGLKSHIMSSEEALEFLQHKLHERLRWLYIDGVHRPNVDTLMPLELELAVDITMTNQIVGG